MRKPPERHERDRTELIERLVRRWYGGDEIEEAFTEQRINVDAEKLAKRAIEKTRPGRKMRLAENA